MKNALERARTDFRLMESTGYITKDNVGYFDVVDAYEQAIKELVDAERERILKILDGVVCEMKTLEERNTEYLIRGELTDSEADQLDIERKTSRNIREGYLATAIKSIKEGS